MTITTIAFESIFKIEGNFECSRLTLNVLINRALGSTYKTSFLLREVETLNITSYITMLTLILKSHETSFL